jgi:CelD/BcsL family acetyltransferase involved in cellulose biosynthesis
VITMQASPILLTDVAPKRGLSVRAHTTAEEFARLRPDWDALVNEGGMGPFSLWGWLYAWHRRVAPSLPLLILAAYRQDGTLRGLLPLYREARRTPVGRVRRVAFLGESGVGSEYLDVIARAEDRDIVTSAFVGWLLEHRDEWDMLEWREMREGSPLLRAGEQAFSGAGLMVEQKPCSSQPYERWEMGATFDDYIGATRRRKNRLRELRRLERQPGLRIRTVTEPGEMPGALAAFMRLHRLRWEEAGGSDAITDPRIEAFHRDATQYLAESGHMALYLMEMEGQAIASLYAIKHRDTFYYYQSGRDPNFNNRSVSAALLAATFRDTFRSGLLEYNTLSGPEPYKLEWASQMHRTKTLRAYSPHGPGARLVSYERWAKRLRAFSKRALPAPVANRLKKWKQGNR